MKEAIQQKKVEYKKMRKNRSEEKKAEYKNIKNRTKKVVANSMRKEAEKGLTKLNKKTNNIFTLVKFMKKDGKDIEGGRCMRGKDKRLDFSEKDRKRIWKNHMEEIMNKENNWNHVTEASMVVRPIKNVSCKAMVIAIKVMKPGKAAGAFEVCAEMISASGEVGVSVMVELCQRVLDGKGMPDEWQTSVLVSIFKEKGYVGNCNTYREVKLLEYAMKIVERVLEKRIQELVNIISMQFGSMPGRGTTDALFVVRRMHEEYRDKKKKLYMCFVDIENAFDRVPRKVIRWAMRKKGLPEVIVRAVMSLYQGAKTKVRVGFELSQEFLVQVGVHQGSVLLPLLFAIAVNVISENARIDEMKFCMRMTWF